MAPFAEGERQGRRKTDRRVPGKPRSRKANSRCAARNAGQKPRASGRAELFAGLPQNGAKRNFAGRRSGGKAVWEIQGEGLYFEQSAVCRDEGAPMEI